MSNGDPYYDDGSSGGGDGGAFDPWADRGPGEGDGASGGGDFNPIDDYLRTGGVEGSIEGDYWSGPVSPVDNSPNPFDVDYGPGSGGSGSFDWNKFLGTAGKYLGKAGDIINTPGGAAGLLGLLAYLTNRKEGKPSGGGTPQVFAGPSKPLTGTVTQGKYGPIMTYNAAQGGLMPGYAQGGPVQMESGGFVMTKRAVDGAGGPQGLRSLVPGARMIRGPGTGTSDDVPAVIQGRSGTTPARLSNGEAYVPRRQVQEQGGAKRLYSLMNQLQGRK